MNRERNRWLFFLSFAALTGVIIAVLIWLYLKAANVGIELIWEKIPENFHIGHYTLIMCLVGGLVVGIFRCVYGPYPENMADSVNRVRTTGSYPYKHLYITVIAALLSLFFGGSVGPEAGLVCMLLALSFWAIDQFRMARQKMDEHIQNDPSVSRGHIFLEMIRGWFFRADRISYDQERTPWKTSETVSAGAVAALAGLVIYIAFNHLFGRAISIPHLASGDIYVKDQLGVVLLMIVGIGAGYLYLFFKKILAMFFEQLRSFGKWMPIFNALLGGLVLGLIGTAMPMAMFSGGSEMQVMQYSYLQYTPFLLILIGVIKLFLTNVCIESGWRGGHFFPVIFSGLSIGYGFSIILGTNQLLSVIVVTGALLGTMLQQPIGALVLSLIFFPTEQIGWMVIATCVAGCIPLPPPLRLNVDNHGFIYNIAHRAGRDRLSVEKLIWRGKD